ncbi:MAG: ATP-dependent helicase [Anaerolineales bacterium]|nr:ATP-dependent helicase [Anaerolineales bacterium]
MITLRPNQQAILGYRSGRMGVSAVPGSGKTWTLSLLAAQIVADGGLADDQEVLVVTLVNSAVENFYRRVSAFVKSWGLLPYMGYRVRTLHGLAHDIVRERPSLVGLSDQFQIVDERESDAIRREAARAWLREHPYDLDDLLDPELDDGRREWLRREPLPDLVSGVSMAFVRYAKDLRLVPERLRELLDGLPLPLPLAEMGWAIYADYQRALAYRGALDFDDLIRLALLALEADPDYLARLRDRWPFILEDEAQDSSRLQEAILEKLAGPGGNWVRVGDPNQAIYETFTTASPRFLRDFIAKQDTLARQLPNSGRSTFSIINLANYLVEWTMNEHPLEEVRDALYAPPRIEPTALDDPQPNPPDDPEGVHLVGRKFTPQEEILAVADSLQRWLPDHQDWTVAVLAPRNLRGFDLVDELRRRGIVYEDGLLRSSSSTRSSAGALANLMHYLSDPGSARKLATVFRVWRRADLEQPESRKEVERLAGLLRKLPHVEDYVWPGPERDWLAEMDLEAEDPQSYTILLEFRRLLRRWQEAILLPVDQMVLTLAQDLLSEPAELALAHKLAVLLRQAERAHPSWRLPEFTSELAVIARNERRFLGFSEDDLGFDPDKYKGKVVVSTMHKAKGLEWDRVYLMSVNNYDFPSAQEYDQYIAEKWFLRDSLNLEAEALAQLDAAFTLDEYEWYREGQASGKARLDYVRERLRLLYVGLTRARRELVVTWNTGRKGNLSPAIPLEALRSFWDIDHSLREETA